MLAGRMKWVIILPDGNGILQYTSLKSLIPKAQNKFTDIWDIEIFKGLFFFAPRTEFLNIKIKLFRFTLRHPAGRLLKITGDKVIAQDKKGGLFQFINNGWQPFDYARHQFRILILLVLYHLDNDSLLISSLQNGLYIFTKGILTKKKYRCR